MDQSHDSLASLMYMYDVVSDKIYRATLCVSAVLAVDGNCPSVCRSLSFIVFKWLKMSSNFFRGLKVPSFQFFEYISAVTPLQVKRGR